MKVHLIAIGGSAMHNLAIALHEKGYVVSGSDDEIFEPSRSRLEQRGLLPVTMGWDAGRITPDLDAVIIGMHARKDNPELLRAQELGLPLYSYPEYLYEQTKDKKRIVIGGSHGKTSITAMVLHVLHQTGIETDYMVGAQLAGFDCMVRLTSSARIAVLEGDEYLSSPIDLRPKFHLYHPHVALISGIAWDHINVFPTYANYVEQFRIFLDKIEPGGVVVYCSADPEVEALCRDYRPDLRHVPYSTHPHSIRDGVTILHTESGEVPLRIFGEHNLQNLQGARFLCREAGVDDQAFYQAIASFGGAARRLEKVKDNAHTAVYKDFAHSPSKLKATTRALRDQFPDRTLVACMELHTFSSLNAAFLDEYKGAMESADVAFVYFNPHTIAHKKLEPITEDQVKRAFGGNNIEVFTDATTLVGRLYAMDWRDRNLLLMTSGNFDGQDFAAIAARICP